MIYKLQNLRISCLVYLMFDFATTQHFLLWDDRTIDYFIMFNLRVKSYGVTIGEILRKFNFLRLF